MNKNNMDTDKKISDNSNNTININHIPVSNSTVIWTKNISILFEIFMLKYHNYYE